MHHQLQKLFLHLPIVLAVTISWVPSSIKAQTYPIDCAILLCLSGGWPASVPCTRARAEFIRRITPWPVEPPLQIWRCPMGASYEIERQTHPTSRIFDILLNDNSDGTLHYSRESDYSPSLRPTESIWKSDKTSVGPFAADYAIQQIQERADIDISGPEFNFVRSIRVFDVRYARQHESGRDGDCNRVATVLLGTYGIQGEFAWQRSSVSALPSAHIGLESWGAHCPSIFHRSVFVDWRDYQGNYGFEQVNY